MYILIFFSKRLFFLNFGSQITKLCSQADAGTEGRRRYSSNPLEGGWWSAPHRGRFTPGKTRYPLYRRSRSVSELLWTLTENLATTGIQSPDRPAHSKTLYRLSYSGVLTAIKSEDRGNRQLYVREI